MSTVPFEALDEAHEDRPGVLEREAVGDADASVRWSCARSRAPSSRGGSGGSFDAGGFGVGRVGAPGRCRSARCRACRGGPAKQAGASKRGGHHQSIEPARDTSAAVRRSPRSAYSSRTATTRKLAREELGSLTDDDADRREIARGCRRRWQRSQSGRRRPEHRAGDRTLTCRDAPTGNAGCGGGGGRRARAQAARHRARSGARSRAS